jgi:hypothetical protein
MCENHIFKYYSENIKNWRNTIWHRESTPVASLPSAGIAAFWLNDLSAAPGGKSLVQSVHDGVDKCGNGICADSNALRHCAFTSPLPYIHRALFCHFIIYNSLLLLLAPLPLHPTNSRVLSFVT